MEERLIALSDGTGMGDEVIVCKTNAPVEKLKALEKTSCDAIRNELEVPIWQDVLEDEGYKFKCIDSHQHVTAFSRSDSWLKREYPEITEKYVIENQPDLAPS